MQAYLDIGGLFDKTALTPVERQVVLLAASAENHCNYCVAAHSMIAKKMVKADAAIVDTLRKMESLPDSKLEALLCSPARWSKSVA
ncbi:MAG: carboxymuconolactone decarboxylase family protein [Methylobacter sp.]